MRLVLYIYYGLAHSHCLAGCRKYSRKAHILILITNKILKKTMEKMKTSVLHTNRTKTSSIYKITLVDRDTGNDQAYSFVVADNYTEVALACLRQVNKIKYSLKINKIN